MNKIPWREFTDADRERMKREDELRFMNRYALNPSRKKLARMIRKSHYEELRGLHVDGDLYWWAAEIATHGQAYRYLGLLERFQKDWENHRMTWDIELHIDSTDDTIYMTAKCDESLDAALLHPTLAGGFTDDGSLIEA